MSSYGEVTASQIASRMPSATTMQNAATGNGDGTSLAVTGYATAILNITASVAMSGGTTINFEGSVDDTTWVSLLGSKVGTFTTGTSTTTTGDWMFNVAGYKSVRARISAYSAGTITIKGFESVLAGPAGSESGSVTQAGTWAVQLLDSGGTNKASISAGGAVKVDGSAATQPISAASLPLPTGASTAAKQPALGTAGSASNDVITVQGIASMTALKVDGSAVTQPVSAASLPLPTGASTAAKQPAIGTAGSASNDVISVQGIASMTALKVDGSAVTQPVSAASLPLPTGASTAAKQPALGTAGSASNDVITVQGIASMTALKVDGSAVTQPVSAAALPLPSGAATSAKQPALGTAGSASSDVLTVQGIASMTALKVDGSAVTQPVSAAALPLPSGAATEAKQPALGTAGTAASDVITVQGIASMTALKVDGSGVTQPVSISGNQAVNVAQINGVTPSMDNGASGTGVQRVTIASDSTGQIAQTASKMPAYTAMQTNQSSNNDGNSLTVTGYATAVLNITASVAMSGGTTINFEGSVDDTTWVSLLGIQVGTTTTGTSTTTTGDWMFNVAGYKSVRARISAYSAGTISVKGYTTVLAGSGGASGGGAGGAVQLLDSGGTNKASISAGGALKVDGSAVTQPVSGTFWQATQPVSGTFWQATQPVSGTFWQATQPVSGTFWQATQPISAASLPLPTNAATSARQAAPGTAGSASTEVVTVQGIASMTPLTVSATNLELAQNSNTSGQVGPLIQGAVTTSAPSYTNAKTSPLSLTTAGALRVDAASLPLPSGAATAAKQPALGTAGSASTDVITVQGIASMTALKVDGSAVTQPVSAASLPLPTGASTAAKQPALGTAGSASSDVITVQGIASMTPLQVTGFVQNEPSTVETFMMTTATYTVPATPTDMIIIGGSGTKTVKILRLRLLAQQNAHALQTFNLIKRSAANTGGTLVDDSGSVGKMDSNNATMTATIGHYTANPSSLGTSAGTLVIRTFMVTDSGSTNADTSMTLYDVNTSGQAITLRGTSEKLALNFAGASLPTGLKVQLEIVLTEE